MPVFSCRKTLARYINENNVFNISKYCLVVLENVGLRMPNRNLRDFSFLKVDCRRRNFPSYSCASAANAIDSDNDIFNGSSVSVNMIG